MRKKVAAARYLLFIPNLGPLSLGLGETGRLSYGGPLDLTYFVLVGMDFTTRISYFVLVVIRVM